MNRKSESWDMKFLHWLFQTSCGDVETGAWTDRDPSALGQESELSSMDDYNPLDTTFFLALLNGDNLMNLQNQGSIHDRATVHQADLTQHLDSQDPLNFLESDGLFADLPRSPGLQFLDLGERSVVEDRFYALLKRRMRAQVEAHPPLFPWESELLEYEDATPAWLPQLQRLQLPVALPQPVLAQLFQRCQDLVQTVHQTGVQLVRSVQPLVPTVTGLQSLAQTVALGAARDDDGSQAYLLGPAIPATYDEATTQQQAVLVLLAAQHLLQKMTLTLSPPLPRQGQLWATAWGPLEITATYTEPLPGQGELDLWASLPAGGQLSCQAGENLLRADRETSGCVNLVVPGVQLDQAYAVDVWLKGGDVPLKLVIHLATAGD